MLHTNVYKELFKYKQMNSPKGLAQYYLQLEYIKRMFTRKKIFVLTEYEAKEVYLWNLEFKNKPAFTKIIEDFEEILDQVGLLDKIVNEDVTGSTV